MRKWALRILGGIAGLVLAACAVLYVLSETKLRHRYTVPVEPIAVPGDAAQVAEGERLAHIHGCFGCHKAGLGGNIFFEEPWVARLVAPNLTRVAAECSDGELARAIRHGVKRDGTGVFVMPSGMFYDLSDADLGAIVAFVRSLPRLPERTPATHVGPLARLGLVTGDYRPETDAIDHRRPRVSPEDLGHYLAATSCTECHGPELRGRGAAPDLAVATGYTEEQFAWFLRTGFAPGGRQTPFMSNTARGRFRFFREAEVHALHAYLKRRTP